MALVLKNGFDVDHATSLVIYENLFPSIKHIAGKGVTEKYVNGDVSKADSVDVMRVLPKKPNYRKLGAQSNGGWHNTNNAQGGYSPESVHYTVEVNHVFDEDTSIALSQLMETKISFREIVNKNITDCFATTLNCFTWATQLYGYIQTATATDQTTYGGSVTAAKAFQDAVAQLANGDMSIGAMFIQPQDCQAFIKPSLNAELKSQYATNASDLAVQINATGFINPFSQREDTRVDYRTGLLGLYDGVVMTSINGAEMEIVEEILGLKSTDTTELALMDNIQGIVVYGGATLRGVVGPNIEANKDPFTNGGVVLAPFAKFGVAQLSGKSVKLITSTALTTQNIAALKAKFALADGMSSAYTGADRKYSSNTKR
jgi:hypothetical protein